MQHLGLTKELIECFSVHQVYISPCVCLEEHTLWRRMHGRTIRMASRTCGIFHFVPAPKCQIVQCYGELDKMFVYMGNTNHICVYWLFPHHQSRGVHWPLPLQCWWKLVELLVSVWNVSLGTPFQSVLSFHSPCTPHPKLCSPVSFGVCLSHICSKFLVGMEASYPFHWVLELIPWPLSPLWLLPLAPDCVDFLPFLLLVDFPILYIVHLCSFLQSVQMLLCGNFQPSYLHDLV